MQACKWLALLTPGGRIGGSRVEFNGGIGMTYEQGSTAGLP